MIIYGKLLTHVLSLWQTCGRYTCVLDVMYSLCSFTYIHM